MSLRLYSEPYSQMGNIGENLKRVLGAPTTDPLQTAVREAFQNIADAARLGSGPRILIRLRRLSLEQRQALREEIFRELPAEPVSAERLRAFLGNPDAFVLEVCDFHTVGLGGPTRADEVPVGTRSTDFIDFMLNVGSPRHTPGGGGTYGFGKAALYRVSRCSTIIVDTLPSDTAFHERRLMACHLGRSFSCRSDGKERRFTGRHWWGSLSGHAGPGAEPVTGDEAARLSGLLGLPERSGGMTGTSIMILDFDLASEHGGPDEFEDPVIIGNRIVETILWNFWPRMMDSTPPGRRFFVDVEVEETRLCIPAPEEFPPLDLFAIAMNKIRSGDDVRPVRSLKPARLLGHLAIQRGWRSPRWRLVPDGSIIPDKAHHIALMRPVELVVKYFEGAQLNEESFEWGGVFRVSEEEEVERAFAGAEPPAHDDWCPASLEERRQKTFVNVALREIARAAQEFAGTGAAQQQRGSGPQTSLAEVADLLGQALETAARESSSPPPVRRGPHPVSRREWRPARMQPVFNRLEEHAGRVVAVFDVLLPSLPGWDYKALQAEVAVLLDGRPARPDPEVTPPPRVLGFRRSGTKEFLAFGNVLRVMDIEGKLEVVVEMPAEAAVTIEILPIDGSRHE